MLAGHRAQIRAAPDGRLSGIVAQTTDWWRGVSKPGVRKLGS